MHRHRGVCVLQRAAASLNLEESEDSRALLFAAASRSKALECRVVWAGHAGVPIPEPAAAAGERVERATRAALKEAAERRLAGAEITPFLLQRIRELTGGASLDSNIALIKNNAAVGSRIAVALASPAAQT